MTGEIIQDEFDVFVCSLVQYADHSECIRPGVPVEFYVRPFEPGRVDFPDLFVKKVRAGRVDVFEDQGPLPLRLPGRLPSPFSLSAGQDLREAFFDYGRSEYPAAIFVPVEQPGVDRFVDDSEGLLPGNLRPGEIQMFFQVDRAKVQAPVVGRINQKYDFRIDRVSFQARVAFEGQKFPLFFWVHNGFQCEKV